MKILVCCHKRDVMATEEPYMPIHVGKALHPDLFTFADEKCDCVTKKVCKMIIKRDRYNVSVIWGSL